MSGRFGQHPIAKTLIFNLTVKQPASHSLEQLSARAPAIDSPHLMKSSTSRNFDTDALRDRHTHTWITVKPSTRRSRNLGNRWGCGLHAFADSPADLGLKPCWLEDFGCVQIARSPFRGASKEERKKVLSLGGLMWKSLSPLSWNRMILFGRRELNECKERTESVLLWAEGFFWCDLC